MAAENEQKFVGIKAKNQCLVPQNHWFSPFKACRNWLRITSKCTFTDELLSDTSNKGSKSNDYW